MPTMTAEVRFRVTPENPSGAQATTTADLMAMVDYLKLPASPGSSILWSGNEADLAVEYDPRTGLHDRSDLLAKLHAWFDAYLAQFRVVRPPAPDAILPEVPESLGLYYYCSVEENWCRVHLMTYLGSVAPGNEWKLRIGATEARVEIGVRYPMLRPEPHVVSFVAGGGT